MWLGVQLPSNTDFGELVYERTVTPGKEKEESFTVQIQSIG
jgi:hypothetical protein